MKLPFTTIPSSTYKKHLEDKGYEVQDFGTFSTDSCDYPVYAKAVAKSVAKGENEKGIIVCGSGIGVSIAANKVKGVRAVVCSEPVTAKLSKEHNNSNIVAFGARIVGLETAKAIVDAWLTAEYQGGRHQTRVDLITAIEERQ